MTQSQALDILKTGANVFLTGEPGSGKTYVTNAYIQYLKSAGIEVAITASTGIAATHIGGITIHAWSGIGIKKSLSEYDLDQIASYKVVAERVEKASVLIIDEISMLDSRTLNMVHMVCKAVRRNDMPFGGLQIILVGDFFQLPPVSSNDAASFAFASSAWAEAEPVVCYITEQHRQEDSTFLDILSAIRRNEVGEHHAEHLEERRRITESWEERSITKLYSHNTDVDRMNTDELEQLSGNTEYFEMDARGKDSLVEQLKRGCLSPENLYLKKDAIVMFTKNSPTGAFVNGTLGTVIGFAKHTNYPIIKTKTGRTIETEPMSWMIEDNGKIKAQISQIPLRLAWAMTVHKSQGISLDEAFIDLRSSFVEGQGYVALSRVRSLEGLYLLGWNAMALRVHPQVLERDEGFRSISDIAEETFSDLEPGELKKMHENFIIACGGVLDGSGAKKEVKIKASTLDTTKEMLLQKMSIEEIAKARGLARGTILGHILDIRKEHPDADIDHIRPDDDIIKRVRKTYESTSDGKLTTLKIALDKEGEEISYDDIRLALMFI